MNAEIFNDIGRGGKSVWGSRDDLEGIVLRVQFPPRKKWSRKFRKATTNRRWEKKVIKTISRLTGCPLVSIKKLYG